MILRICELASLSGSGVMCTCGFSTVQDPNCGSGAVLVSVQRALSVCGITL